VAPPRHLFNGPRQPVASRHWPSLAGLQHPLQELDGPLVRLRAEVAAWEAELNGAVARWTGSSPPPTSASGTAPSIRRSKS